MIQENILLRRLRQNKALEPESRERRAEDLNRKQGAVQPP